MFVQNTSTNVNLYNLKCFYRIDVLDITFNLINAVKVLFVVNVSNCMN